MTTSTFSVTCPHGEWTLVASGDEYTTVALQTPSPLCALVVANEAPAVGTVDFVLLNQSVSPLSLTLAAGDNIYAQGLGGPVTVRGFRTTST